MKKGFPVSTRLTAAQIAAGIGNNIAGGFIETIDATGQPTGALYVAGPTGSPPAAIGAGAAGTELAWAASVTVQAGEIRRATVAVGTIGIGDRIASNSARTTGATFNVTEAANWTELPEDPDVVLLAGAQTISGAKTFSALPELGLDATTANQPVRKSQHDTALSAKAGTAVATTTVSGLMANTDKTKLDNVAAGATANATDAQLRDRSTHTGAQATSTVTGLDTALAGKQATLVSGTHVKTLNSQSIVGPGDIAVGASTASVTSRDGGAGGAITDINTAAGVERVHVFTASGSFVVPAGVSAVQVLAVAGAGGGGAGRYRGDAGGRPGGGGGAGGLVYNATFVVTPSATMAVVVGLGGPGATDVDDSDAGTGGAIGGDTTFGSITCKGGGGGGGHHETNSAPWDVPADQGGSGGGGSNGSGGATKSAASTTAGNSGNSGGNFGGDSGGGGGGAGGAGGNGNLPSAGNGGAGGAGLANSITGTSVTYAAGGQGSSGSSTTGHSGAAGTANLGNGGGGAFDGGSDGTAGAKSGGNGGSGVVIVRYLYQSLDTPIYANNAAAIAGGFSIGDLYRTGADPDVLCVVH